MQNLYRQREITQIHIAIYIYIFVLMHDCRQRAPVENVSSTSDMYVKRYFFKEDSNDFRRF